MDHVVAPCPSTCPPHVVGHILCRAHLAAFHAAACAGKPDPARSRAWISTWTPERRRAAADRMLHGAPVDGFWKRAS